MLVAAVGWWEVVSAVLRFLLGSLGSDQVCSFLGFEALGLSAGAVAWLWDAWVLAAEASFCEIIVADLVSLVPVAAPLVSFIFILKLIFPLKSVIPDSNLNFQLIIENA